MKQELLNQLDQIQTATRAFEPVVKQYIQDETKPIEDRWEVFAAVPREMLTHPWLQSLNFGGMEISWYDDHYIERKETVDNIDVVSRYEENIDDPEYSEQMFRTSVTQEKINQLKADILKSGIRYWTYDW